LFIRGQYTDPSTKPGSHWIAIFIAMDGNAEILTAMDLNESNVESILSFLARYSRIGWNTVPIQGPFSSVCGHYCIYFVIQRCNNRSMHEIIKQLSVNDAEENDEMITDWINEQFDVDTDTYDINFLINQICHSR